MRIGRSIIIPAILALSAAGSILAGTATSAVVASAPSAHVVTVTATATPDTHYWG
jgi:hypothetical protein